MKWHTIVLLLLAALLVISNVACDKGEKAPSPKAQPPKSVSEAAPAEAPATKVIAKAGDATVTKEEIDQAMEARDRQVQMMLGGHQGRELTPEQKEQQRRDAIKSILAGKLVLEKAKKLGITVTDEEVEERLATLFKMYGGKEKFLKIAGKDELDEEQMRHDMRDSLLREKYMEQEVYSKIPEPSEEEVREWYDKHKERFGSPEMVKAYLITVKTAPDAAEEDLAEARTKIDKAAERLKAGEDFAVVAKEVSEDRWAEKGGEIGFVQRGQLKRVSEELDKLAFEMDPDKLSDVLRTKEGFVLFKITEKKEAKEKTFDEAREQIEKMLPGIKKFQASAKFQEEMKRETEVEFLE